MQKCVANSIRQRYFPFHKASSLVRFSSSTDSDSEVESNPIKNDDNETDVSEDEFTHVVSFYLLFL